MPFKTEDRFKKLLKIAVEDREIQKGINDAGLTAERLINQFNYKTTEIWGVALNDILDYDNLETQITDIEKNVKDAGFTRSQGSLNNTRPSIWTIVFVLILILGLLSPWLLFRDANSFAELVSYFLSSSFKKIISTILSSTICFLIFSYVRGFFRYRRLKKENLKYSNDLEAWMASNFELAEKFKQMDQSKERLKNLGEATDQILLEKSIKDNLRVIINGYLAPSYKIQLDRIEAPGLAEVIDPSKTIDTSARQTLKFLLESMPGASIGIAGPRGAGKSTLIQTYCGANRSIEKIKGYKILPVMTSAPVQYEARDFILYLFNTTCQSVLKQEGVPLLPQNFNDIQDVANPTYQRFTVPLLRFMYSFFLLTSIILLVISMLLTIIYANYSSGQIESEYNNNKGKGDTTKINQQKMVNENKPGARIEVNQPGSSVPYYVVFLRVLKFDPGTLLACGLTFLGFFFVSRRILNLRKGRIKFTSLSETKAASAIVNEAQQWIKQIKFQQTFTSGWSGGLKLPIGLEGGINKVLTIAERQMTNPEIVSAFTQFLSNVPKEYKIIIGIDELDKIESDELAQKFLNEIKSIFGLPNCFYLISVSENAMHNFERRGLPFRDVFDSSFDSVIYIDYLNFESAKLLLQRRVIGKPIPFFCLSYCFSGGLPRDLIRTFRQILKIRNSNNSIDNLAALTNFIIQEDVIAKVRAITSSMRKLQSIPNPNRLFSILFDFQTNDLNDSSIIENLKRFNDWKKEIPVSSISTDSGDLNNNAIFKSCEELFSYLYFMSTLLNLFVNTLNEEKFKEIEFNKLAQARQMLSVDTSISRSIILEFRKANNMSILKGGNLNIFDSV